ncbi:MAG: hypothetical protein LBC61_04495 [Candidatus Peribacteria bacterium]|jgi:hypothetical protein|nr:hypothetical protein [Candidatus Peribacteria bacterium]
MTLMLLFCGTTLAANLPYKYIEVLDKVIARLETYQDNPSYIQLLDSFVAQLNTLKPRYTSS